MKFVVNRAKWRAGDEGENAVGKGPTSLRNSDGFMCCLGHCALQLGAKPSEILDCGMPNEVTDKNGNYKVLPVIAVAVNGQGYSRDSSLSEQAAEINDDDKLTQAQRERKLKTLFSKFKHKLEFVGVARKNKAKKEEPCY